LRAKWFPANTQRCGLQTESCGEEETGLFCSHVTKFFDEIADKDLHSIWSFLMKVVVLAVWLNSKILEQNKLKYSQLGWLTVLSAGLEISGN
jgi:hypothetical protein